ncbi:MAG TPA: hypothetical protein VMV22_08350, partial [Acidimicrobiales bacterium]|nr:hypothetical protein [Acidimicrobiales bacterium]
MDSHPQFGPLVSELACVYSLSLDPPIGDLWGTERSDRQGDEANVVAWSAFIGRRGVLDQAFVKFT